MRALAAIVMLVAVLSPIRADNQPAAAEPAKQLLVFKNVGEFPEYSFYVCRADLQDGKSAIRVPESGQITISNIDPAARQAIFLFAVPNKLLAKPNDPPRVEWFSGDFPGVLKSKPLVGFVSNSGSDERVPAGIFWISFENELIVTKLESAPATFTAPQVEIERAIAYGLVSSVDRRIWIVGGSMIGIAVVLAFWLTRRILANGRR